MSSTSLFQGRAGAAVQGLASPAGTAGTISVITDIKHGNTDAFTNGLPGLFKDYSAIITGLDIQEAANANAMYAADGRIYMHVPGDKLGSLTVSGIAFSINCENTSMQSTGLVKMLEWYRAHRVSNPNFSSPIQITLTGGILLEGYLGSFSSRLMDIVHQIYSFTLPMYLVPGEIPRVP